MWGTGWIKYTWETRAREEEEEEAGGGDITVGVTDRDGQHDIIQKTQCVFLCVFQVLLKVYLISQDFSIWPLYFHPALNIQSLQPW